MTRSNDWQPCNPKLAASLSAATENPNTIYHVENDAVDQSLTGMPGFIGLFASTFVKPKTLVDSTSAANGYFVATRKDPMTGTYKNYRWWFLLNENGFFYNLEHDKSFDAHYVEESKVVSLTAMQELVHNALADADRLKSKTDNVSDSDSAS